MKFSFRGNDAVVLRPGEDQVDGMTVDVCRLTDVLDNVNGVNLVSEAFHTVVGRLFSVNVKIIDHRKASWRRLR